MTKNTLPPKYITYTAKCEHSASQISQKDSEHDVLSDARSCSIHKKNFAGETKLNMSRAVIHPLICFATLNASLVESTSLVPVARGAEWGDVRQAGTRNRLAEKDVRHFFHWPVLEILTVKTPSSSSYSGIDPVVNGGWRGIEMKTRLALQRGNQHVCF